MLKNKFFLTSTAIAIIVSLIHILFCVDVYDDIANFYGPIAAAFGRSEWAVGLCPQVPILNSTLAGLLVKCGIHPFSALVIVSSVFYILGIPLVYLMAKVFLKRSDFAAMTCLLYVVAPKIIRFSCTGLLNSSRNTFALAGVVLLLYFRIKPAWWKSLALGAVTACLALARGEAIAFAPLFGLWLGFLVFEKYKFKFQRKFFLELALHWALLVGVFLLCAMPRMIQLYTDKEIGYPVLDVRQAYSLDRLMGHEVDRYPNRIIVNLPGIRHHDPLPPGRKLYDGLDGFVNGAYIPYLLFAVLGVVVMIRKKELARPESILLLLVMLINFAVFVMLANSLRYYTINLLMLLPFTFAGIRFIWDYLNTIPYSRYWKAGAVLLMVGVAIAQVVNGMAKVISKYSRTEYNTGIYIRSLADELKLPQGDKMKVAGSKSQFAFWSGAKWLNTGNDSVECIKINKELLTREADFFAVGRKNPVEAELVESMGFVKTDKQPSRKYFIYRKRDN